jgi:hypothetical protein
MTESLATPVEDAETEHESSPGVPAWVKAVGVALVILFLVFVVLHLTGNAPTHGMP